MLHTLSVPSASSEETHIPITQWDIPPNNQPITAQQDMKQFFSLALAKPEQTNRHADIKESANQEQTHWSRWVLLDTSRPRLPVAVPVSTGIFFSLVNPLGIYHNVYLQIVILKPCYFCRNGYGFNTMKIFPTW